MPHSSLLGITFAQQQRITASSRWNRANDNEAFQYLPATRHTSALARASEPPARQERIRFPGGVAIVSRTRNTLAARPLKLPPPPSLLRRQQQQAGRGDASKGVAEYRAYASLTARQAISDSRLPPLDELLPGR